MEIDKIDEKFKLAPESPMASSSGTRVGGRYSGESDTLLACPSWVDCDRFCGTATGGKETG